MLSVQRDMAVVGFYVSNYSKQPSLAIILALEESLLSILLPQKDIWLGPSSILLSKYYRKHIPAPHFSSQLSPTKTQAAETLGPSLIGVHSVDNVS